MAQRHSEILDAGGRMIGVSVDTPGQHAAMVAKLNLPFPLLSDPDRTKAIGPYGVIDEHDKRNISRPATVLVTPAGDEVWRTEGRDYADRPFDEDVVAAVRSLDLPATTQPAPAIGQLEPGPTAFAVEQMVPYYRGARFAAVAMGRRFPEAKDDADRYVAQLDVYIEAAKELYRSKKSSS